MGLFHKKPSIKEREGAPAAYQEQEARKLDWGCADCRTDTRPEYCHVQGSV